MVSYPDGRATLDELNADLAILSAAGPEWGARLKRLAASVPDLDIFVQRLVVRDSQGWQITAAGKTLLRAIEAPAPAKRMIEIVPPEPAPAEIAAPPEPPIELAEQPSVQIVGLKDRSRRRRRAVKLDRSA